MSPLRRLIIYIVIAFLAVFVLLSVSDVVNVGAIRCGDCVEKVWICHVPSGNPENQQSLHVSVNGWNGHDKHDLDYEGMCKPLPPTCDVESWSCEECNDHITLENPCWEPFSAYCSKNHGCGWEKVCEKDVCSREWVCEDTCEPEPTPTEPEHVPDIRPAAPPEWSDPCFYLSDHEECKPKTEVFPDEGEVFGPQK